MATRKSTRKRKGPRAQPADARRKLTEYRRKRDFAITPEPSDAAPAAPSRAAPDARGHLRFVIQKHAASHLHFDLRLELDGVMKSWAVPKGPSLDPSVKRLAMQVEDHPIAYNSFEGIIPPNEYGGGTVMLWDRGTYYPDEADGGDHEAALRRELRQGKVSISFEGERLRGSFALVRTDGGPKPKWLLIKHRDASARRGYDITADVVTSVDTGRTMDEIARGDSAVWHSDRGPGSATRHRRTATPPAGPDPASLAIEPMRPALRRRLPAGEKWRFEPAPGGTRALAYVTAESSTLVDDGGAVRGGWPQLTDALQALARRARTAFVLDGEIVEGEEGPAYHAFDLLLTDGQPLLDAPWGERRAALESLFRRRRVPGVQLVTLFEDAAGARAHALREALPALRARAADGRYTPGTTSRAWLEQPLDA